MTRTAVFSIASLNYWAYARTWVQSFKKFHRDIPAFVLAVDEVPPDLKSDPEEFTIVSARELGIPHFDPMAFRYDVTELNTALKPFFFDYLFEKKGFEKICYFDPDISFYDPISEIFDILDSAPIVLTPHLTDFLDDGRHPDEVSILQAGTYNLGFLGLAAGDETRRLLAWWQKRLTKQCVVDVPRGLFVDQKWIDLVPGIFPKVHVHRDPGCNVAYWNLKHRQFTGAQDRPTVNGSALKFFHFSGFSTDNMEAISRHQDRYTLSQLPALRPLFEDYARRLKANGHESWRKTPYAFARFDNQVPIPDSARKLFREYEERNLVVQSPFRTDGQGSFVQWLNGSATPELPAHPLITRIAAQIWKQRPDLQVAFPDYLGRQRWDFADWFVRSAPAEYKLDATFILPVQRSLERLPGFVRDLWRRCYTEGDGRFLQWINCPAFSGNASAITRFAYELYRNREDLQKAFPRIQSTDLVAFLRWFTVHGAEEYHLDSFLVEPAAQALRRWGNPSEGARAPSPGVANLSRWIRDQAGRVLEYGSAQRSACAAKLPEPMLRASPHGQFPHGLNLVGYLADETGVGEVARAIGKALAGSNLPLAITPIKGSAARDQDASVLHLPQGNPYAVNLLNVNADQAPIVVDNLGSSFFAGRYNIGYWFWELDRFPRDWHDSFRYFDEIWVGSSHVQHALAQVSPVPVVLMPPPIVSSFAATSSREALGLPPERTLFLFVFDGLSYIERKNPFAVIEAFRRAFGPACSDATLVLKTTNLDRNPALAQRLRKDMRDVGGLLIEGYWDREALSSLFHCCDAYVSLHRAEGFGLTLAEAMLLGKPVIATGYSATMDFMTPHNSFPVDFQLVEIQEDVGPYQKGCRWADPDPHDAAQWMKYIVDHPQQAAQRGLRAKADIEQWFGPQAIAARINERLDIIQKHALAARSRSADA